MVKRTFWLNKIEQIWQNRSLVWLAGVRRSGKTYLCRSIDKAEMFDCELPRTRKIIEDDPEGFLSELRGRKIILDEIHRLKNPSEVLKIATDHYPDIKVVATGSSTLGASKKFGDTLTGRKDMLWLTPMGTSDLKDFSSANLSHRFLHGGLPPFFLNKKIEEREYQEWLDSFWAKDILEMFNLKKKEPFMKLMEMIFTQSGGQFNANELGPICGITHTTAAAYLEALKSTFAAHVIRPFSTRKESEIVKQPKVYAFDTGFVCYFKGISSLRADDMGIMWEHFVLNEMHAHQILPESIHYWRDKQGKEVDFVIENRSHPKAPVAIECKWSSSHFNAKALAAFRGFYPDGDSYVVCHDIDRSYAREMQGMKVHFVSLFDLLTRLASR